jgi:hypothetical protein
MPNELQLGISTMILIKIITFIFVLLCCVSFTKWKFLTIALAYFSMQVYFFALSLNCHPSISKLSSMPNELQLVVSAMTLIKFHTFIFVLCCVSFTKGKFLTKHTSLLQQTVIRTLIRFFLIDTRQKHIVFSNPKF